VRGKAVDDAGHPQNVDGEVQGAVHPGKVKVSSRGTSLNNNKRMEKLFKGGLKGVAASARRVGGKTC